MATLSTTELEMISNCPTFEELQTVMELIAGDHADDRPEWMKTADNMPIIKMIEKLDLSFLDTAAS